METLLLQKRPILEPPCAPSLNQPETLGLKRNNPDGQFSFFSKPVTNTVPTRQTNILEVYQMIVSDRYQAQTRVLRCLSDPTIARSYKARNFDFICASGVFVKRSEGGMVHHSGLLTLDFDHVPYPPKLRYTLSHDRHFETALCFISPSGDGLKWIVEINIEKYTHLEWFTGLEAYVRATYHLEIDPSGKDVSRCCFLPCDPEAYINPKYL